MLDMCLVTRVFLQANSCLISKMKRVRHRHVKCVNQRRKEENIVHNISYMGCMKDLWLTFSGKANMVLQGYLDGDWASQPHHHLISGFTFHYGQGTIFWSLKKQVIVTLLSTEGEYVTKTHASKEGIWLKTFIKEVTGRDIGPFTILANNQGAITPAKDNKFHARMKNID
jgi:hypothetical protein